MKYNSFAFEWSRGILIPRRPTLPSLKVALVNTKINKVLRNQGSPKSKGHFGFFMTHQIRKINVHLRQVFLIPR
jgi:hypothetical protein